MPGERDELVLGGGVELVVWVKFGAETDSGVRFDPTVSHVRLSLDFSIEIAVTPNRPHPNLHCARVTV